MLDAGPPPTALGGGVVVLPSSRRDERSHAAAERTSDSAEMAKRVRDMPAGDCNAGTAHGVLGLVLSDGVEDVSIVARRSARARTRPRTRWTSVIATTANTVPANR